MYRYNEADLLSFDEFAQAVGAKSSRVRRALREMQKQPIPFLSDGRRMGYPRQWAEEVRQWLITHLYGDEDN